VIYVGPPPNGAKAQKTVELEDAMAILGDTAAISLDDVVYATFDGALPELDRALDRVFAEGLPPVAVVRSLQRHASNLHLNVGRAAASAPPESIIARMGRVHFSRRASLLRQLRLWPAPRAADALGQILETEMECKTTGMPDEALARRLCLRLAQAARRADAAGRRDRLGRQRRPARRCGAAYGSAVAAANVRRGSGAAPPRRAGRNR
jgi:DNA polymerase-3 subunit delta